MSNSGKKQVFESLDLFKFIMAVFVVDAHTRPLIKCNNQFVNALNTALIALSVPFFFLASGFLLASKLSYPYKDQNSLKKIKKSLFRTIKMYLFWNIVYLPLTIYDDISRKITFSEAWHDYLQGLFFTGGHTYSFMLWYLLSAIYALAFIYFMLKYTSVTPEHLCLCGTLILIISIGLDRAAENTGSSLPGMLLIRKVLQYTILNGRNLAGFFYIPLGMLFAKRTIGTKTSVLLFAAGFICRICIQDPSIAVLSAAVSSVGFFSLVLKLRLPHLDIFPLLRKISTDIYFMHLLMWTVFCHFVYGKRTSGLLPFTATMLLCLIFSLIHIAVDTWRKRNRH